ncbi:MAG TPA: phospho-N-acetylmuramoyl-pentapeptide-transferase [Acidimicrobiales bacterium]|nr:phospho-N-acetylmuramoyl-pentapeptide-transferase [Acidimicrobiales bacterium]
MTAGGVALWVAALGTPLLIRWLARNRIGQQIREDGPRMHLAKAGTPTMGGLAMLVALFAGYTVAHVTRVVFTGSGILVVLATFAFGGIGLADDWIKVRHRRSLGLNKRAKLGAQILVAIGFALGAEHWAGVHTTLAFTRFDSPGIQLGSIGWIAWAVFVMVGTSNAVNLTDGLDGLASGSATFCLATLAVIGYWQFRHFSIYHLAGFTALDLALVAVALAGACLGFLWWNAAPARIFMGDTGSLAVGAGLGGLCLLMSIPLLLAVIGGLFVLETLSVLLQVISYRVFKRRIFRMAPLHHHFELVGWPEVTVIVRFWILAGLFAALGLGIFYADFLTVSGLR